MIAVQQDPKFLVHTGQKVFLLCNFHCELHKILHEKEPFIFWTGCHPQLVAREARKSNLYGRSCLWQGSAQQACSRGGSDQHPCVGPNFQLPTSAQRKERAQVKSTNAILRWLWAVAADQIITFGGGGRKVNDKETHHGPVAQGLLRRKAPHQASVFLLAFIECCPVVGPSVRASSVMSVTRAHSQSTVVSMLSAAAGVACMAWPNLFVYSFEPSRRHCNHVRAMFSCWHEACMCPHRNDAFIV